MTKISKPFFIFGILTPIITVIMDQVTKYWVIKSFDLPMNICEINPFPGLQRAFNPVFDLALVCNQGVSFGLLSGDSSLKRWLLTIFAVVMCAVLLYSLRKSTNTLTRLSLGLIVGGAIGNGIDRALYGAVTDFIHVEKWLSFFPWVFNVADSAITIGVIGLMAASFLIKPDETAAVKPN